MVKVENYGFRWETLPPIALGHVMRERLFITISDDRNIRQYAVHRLVGRALIYALSGHTLLFVVGLLGLGWMAHQYDALKFAKDALAVSYQAEAAKKNRLRDAAEAEIDQLKQMINDKRQELNIISQVADAKPAKVSFAINRFSTKTQLSNRDAALFERAIPSGSPVSGMEVSSGFGNRIHPIFHKRFFHFGMDFDAPIGTPVQATADGVVEYARDSVGGYGRLITLRHAHEFRTAYAHLNDALVVPGQVVRKGDVIAASGNTGNSTGPHLHYEIIYKGKPLNPYPFVALEQSDSEQPQITEARRTSWDSLLASRTQ